MRIIIIILGTLCFCSCSLCKLINVTDCDINEKIIIKILQEQKTKITKAIIRRSYELYDKHDCSAFYLAVIEWENVTRIGSYVSIPILQTSHGIYVNAYYKMGELREEFDEQIAKEYVDFAIQLFREENIDNFNKMDLNEIEDTFRYGVEIFSPYYR